MEKEISIFKKIKDRIDKNKNLHDNLEIIASFLSGKYGIKIYFCEILGGRRWSYIAGSKDVMAPTKKIKINSILGLVIDNYEQLDKEEWNNIIKIIKELQ
ncbi:MAG: hypothetical protein FXF47_00915 [Candidatus Mcinerneyibacterium aminivorans]|jgi:hypothetical protein|uniref:Uncharacterized protein n=1 Tax=Candidatus Mcinerneyibacterium aminivorans TaxID=2703815 RepID=A0A5D0MI40_9BACT|nr:MAG: hypothetical protein FXF47_00915 [Candidatus Mcinerneyibacterium aminivorans]